MRNAVFWDVAVCESCKDRLYIGTCCLHLQGRKNPRTKKSVSSWLTDFSILKMEATRSSETSVELGISCYIMRAQNTVHVF
jgi:hypothetical protein